MAVPRLAGPHPRPWHRHGYRGDMPHINGFATHPGFTELLAVSKGDEGPGALLRTVIVVGVVGIALLAWFLLRGYGNKD